jgi:tetracycline repressor-like protein
MCVVREFTSKLDHNDDGNPQLRAKAGQALSSLLDRLQSIAEEGQRRGEVRADVDSAKLATLIVSTLALTTGMRPSEYLGLKTGHNKRLASFVASGG